MESALTGILNELTTPLRLAKVPIYAISTWCVYFPPMGAGLIFQEHRLHTGAIREARQSGGSTEENWLDIRRLARKGT